MKPSKALLIGCLFCRSLAAQAQAAQADGPRKVTIYLTADGKQLPTADGADHQAEITMRDSVAGRMREYYPSGKLWRVIPLAHVSLGIRHGVVMTYDEAGKLRKREDFVAGQRQGELQLFDANGTLSRTMVYDKGKRVSQQCFTPAGQLQDCQVDKQMPVYPNGMIGLIKAIEKVAVLPTEEVSTHGAGIVFIKLVLDSHATIVAATVVKAPTINMGQAVLDAVKRIPPFQAPGLVDQEPVPILYALPIKIGTPANGWNMSNAYDASPTVTFLAAE
jgi:hypothetical protein